MPNYSSDRPANFYFGGGGDTFAPPFAIFILVLAAVLIIVLPRKYAALVFLLVSLLIPISVTVVVAGLHFGPDRILLTAGWIRLLTKGELRRAPLEPLDKCVIYGALINSIAYVLAWRQFGAVVNRFGFLWSTLGTYLLLRSLIRTKEDVLSVIKTFAVVVVVVGPAMWYEHKTAHNVFAVVGAPEVTTDVRYGKIRASGPFESSIIAGTLGVVSIPLFVGLFWYGRWKTVCVLAILSSCLMMLASSSSTPVMSLPAALLAVALWRFRGRMLMVRRILVAGVACLQLEMALNSGAPVWMAIDRISGFLGGSGWHRAMLIDNFVRHFFEWCLIGTRNYPDWGWSMWDVDNAFVGAGVMGGLPCFILFVWIFVHGFRIIGRAIKTMRTQREKRLTWAIGSALFANLVGFFGIVYFDQSVILWYALLIIVQVVPTFELKHTINSERVRWKSRSQVGEALSPAVG